MAQLLMIREKIKSFYSRFEGFCKPALKFLLALVTLMIVNKGIPFASVLTSLPVMLVLALICSFFPMNFILVIGVLVVLLHLYALSLETVLITGVFFLLMFLLYFRFAPKDTILLLLTPICFTLKIPYVVPICAGLVGSPVSVISTGCGVVSWHLLHYIAENKSSLMTQESDPIFQLDKLRVLIDALLNNREMQVLVAAFAVTILCVYIIRRLPVDHCWTIAMITGMLIDIVVILVGDLRFETRISIPGLIIGSLVALAVAVVLQFFVFNVDYTRTERVQFEDDEYYYYVKAVPKNSVSLADRKVKKIKGREKPGTPASAEGGTEKERRDSPEYRVRRSKATIEQESRKTPPLREETLQDISGSVARNKNRTKRIILPEDTDQNT
ncbi:MAG: hypothetical protein K6E50_00130 [Lachnospiraceae bacterium]|nr:hypothetical protein [Lachnospiraceae bacterium]